MTNFIILQTKIPLGDDDDGLEKYTLYITMDVITTPIPKASGKIYKSKAI